jgi:P27 family predicted phage terminase small subunit
MARNTQPPDLRILKNDRAHAHRHAGVESVEPSKSKAKPPKNLSIRAVEIFNEIVELIEEMYPCSKTDSYALGLYANNHEQLEYYEEFLKANGSTFISTFREEETPKARPEYGMHKDCKALELKILAQFGLTPVSRNNVKIKAAPKKKNAFADLDLDEVNG